MKTGIKGAVTFTVRESDTALAVGSGNLRVLATPVLAAAMEKAAWTSVQTELEEGSTTVGTRLALSHTAPTPVGMAVRCETELTAIDGRRLVFRTAAYDAAGCIAEAEHERVIVRSASFREKADRKTGI